jgi:hypothetical protein
VEKFEERKFSGKPKTFTSATLFIKNPTFPDLGFNPGRVIGKAVTNRLNHVAA